MAIIVCAIFILITIILLTGHGTFLVAGYNTLTKEEKEKLNKKKTSRQAGWLLLLIDIPIIALTTLDFLGKMKDSYALAAAAYIILVIVVFMFIGNKKQK